MALSDKQLRQKVAYARARLKNLIDEATASDSHFADIEAALTSRIDAAEPPVVVPPVEPPPVVPDEPDDPPPAPSDAPVLPRRFVDLRLHPTTGRIISVAAGDSIQAAIDIAVGGDEIVIQPGATYVGALTLPKRADKGWVTIRSGGVLPPVGRRVSLLDAPKLARLVSPGANQPVIRTALGARGWRLVGLHATTEVGATVGALVVVNGHEAKTVDEQPSYIILDRMLVMGRPDQSFQRGVLLNGSHVAVIDSYVGECHAKGMDSQAIIAWQGSGPYHIENNFLEGSGENVMFGGSDSRSVDLMPSDITIRRNHFFKPQAWRGVWLVKNLLELKVGTRVLVEGNVFDGCWTDGQTGFGILFKSTNQNGSAPWSETRDVTFRANWLRNAERGISLAGRPETHPAVPMSRILIADNFVNVEKINVQLAGVRDVTLDHNTWTGASHILNIASGGSHNLALRGNAWPRTEYGVHSSSGSGDKGLSWGAPGWVSEGNTARTGIRNASIPSGTVILANDAPDVDGVGMDRALLDKLTAGVV